MILTILTDSCNTYTYLDSIIEKQTINTEHDKYIFFKCKEDFLEALYMIANAMTSSGTSLDTIERQKNYIIQTWFSTRKRKYQKSYNIDDSKFTF